MPNSLIGLAVAAVAALPGGRWRLRGGVLEASSPRLGRLLALRGKAGLGIEAITFGHVVIGRDADCLDRCREHELVHVRQYARWGPFFLPTYLLSSAWQALRGRDPYRDNRFEREAFSLEPIPAEPETAGGAR